MLVKTKSTVFCSTKQKTPTLPEVNMSLSVNNDPIEPQVQTSTYLGVVVDDNFQFNAPFDN